eukprot:3048683-Prymnesium_polylepis.1
MSATNDGLRCSYAAKIVCPEACPGCGAKGTHVLRIAARNDYASCTPDSPDSPGGPGGVSVVRMEEAAQGAAREAGPSSSSAPPTGRTYVERAACPTCAKMPAALRAGVDPTLFNPSAFPVDDKKQLVRVQQLLRPQDQIPT